MRKLMAILALMSAVITIGVGTAVTQAGAGGFTCTYSVSPAVLPPGGGTLTVAGNAPGTSLVQIYYDPTGAAGPFLVAGDIPTNEVTGAFRASFFVNVAGEVLVAVDDYAELPCIGNAGAGANRAGAGRSGTGRLPATGASDLDTYILSGLAALTVGLVLVISAQRRNAIRGRA